MTRQFLLICSFVCLICLGSAQAQFTIEVNVSGDWKKIADGDFDPDQAEAVFGPVETGVVVDRGFRFTNNTGDTVAVSDVSFGGSGFEAFLTETEIKTGESKNFTVRYTAGAASVDSVCTVTNDSPGTTASYDFTLRGLVTPPYTVSGRSTSGEPFEEISSGDTSPESSDGTLFARLSLPGSTRSNEFKLSNSGSQPITFTGQSFSGPQAAEFTVVDLPSLPFTLEASAEETFTLRWTAFEAGQRDATFELLSELSPAPFTFAISGTANESDIEVTPEGLFFPISEHTRIQYGPVDLGEQESRSYTIENRGFGTLFVTSITADNPTFTVGHSIVGIAPGEEETFTIDFAPTVVGTQETVITIESNAPRDKQTFTFSIEGFGENNVGSPEIAITSPLLGTDIPPGPPLAIGDRLPLGFPADVVVGNSATREFVISNIGDSPLAITGMTFDDPTHFSVPDLNTTVPAGGEITITATYQPTGVGFHSATLSIANNDPDEGENGPESPYELYFSGRGVELAPDIGIRVVGRDQIPIGSAPSVALGTLLPTKSYGEGPDYYSFTIQIENEGDAPLNIFRMITDLSVTGPSGLLEPGGSRELVITGNAPGPGTYRNRIVVLNNDGDESVYVFDLQITVTPEGDSGARITSIAANGADIDLGVELPAAGNYFIDESEDLTTCSLMNPPSFSGQQGSQTQTLPGRATPPASGQRFFRLRLE